MRCSFITLLIGTVLALAAEPKELGVPPEKAADAKVLIAKLDDDDVEVRDKAYARLEKLGRFALPALLEAAKGKPSNEVQNRLETLIPVARKADFDARADLFLADNEGKQTHDLLGWSKLAEVAGDTKESRKLFRNILADDALRADLLLSQATTKSDLKTFDHRWERKTKEWKVAKRLGPSADAPITFVAVGWLADLVTAHERDENGGARTAVVTMYLERTDEGKLVAQGKGAYGDVPLKLAKKWIATRRGYYELLPARHLCRDLNLGDSEALQVLERMADWTLEYKTGYAHEIGYLAMTGNPERVSLLKRYFDLGGVMVPGRGDDLPDVQHRDAALAMCLVLTDQDPAEYGFGMQYKPKADLLSRINTQNYFFKADDNRTADEKRTAAFKKWAEWEKANPDKVKPPEKKEK